MKEIRDTLRGRATAALAKSTPDARDEFLDAIENLVEMKLMELLGKPEEAISGKFRGEWTKGIQSGR